MIKFALKVGDNYLKCSKRNTFAPTSLSNSSLYSSRGGAVNASKAAKKHYLVEIVKIELKEVTEK